MENKLKVAVLGAGSWGTAISNLLFDNGHEVTLWSHSKEEIDEIKRTHENASKLPGVKLPDSMNYSADLEESVKGAEVIVLAVPSSVIRGMAAKVGAFSHEGQIVVTVSKGIEEGTFKTQSQIAEEEIKMFPLLRFPARATPRRWAEDFRQRSFRLLLTLKAPKSFRTLS